MAVCREIKEDETGSLFGSFVQDRLKADGMNTALDVTGVLASMNMDAVPSNLRDAAKSLTSLASAFANSPERQKVKEIALAQSPDVKQNHLVGLLQSMLDPTRREELQERIVVAFYFCYDFLMRMAQRGVQMMKDFLFKCTKSIVEVLDPIVAAAGGWSKILVTAAATGIFFTAVSVVVGTGLLLGKMLSSD